MDAAGFYKWVVEITQKPESAKGFIPKLADGRSKEASLGSISSAVWQRSMKKQSNLPSLLSNWRSSI